MPITADRAKALIVEFCVTYPVACQVDYKIRHTAEELYGKEATSKIQGIILGGYVPGNSQFHRGRCDFAVANIRNDDDFKATLRHEILGHFGINTFTANEKRAVLDTIATTRENKEFSLLWSKVDAQYGELPEQRKAEEIYAFACEDIVPNPGFNKTQGEQSLNEICIQRIRPMQERDLLNIVTLVAEGMRDRSRAQQNYPATANDQFRKENTMDQDKHNQETINAEYKRLVEHSKQVQSAIEKKEKENIKSYNPMQYDTSRRHAGDAYGQGHKDAIAGIYSETNIVFTDWPLRLGYKMGVENARNDASLVDVIKANDVKYAHLDQSQQAVADTRYGDGFFLKLKNGFASLTTDPELNKMHGYFREVLCEKYTEGLIKMSIPDITDKKSLAFTMAVTSINKDRVLAKDNAHGNHQRNSGLDK